MATGPRAPSPAPRSTTRDLKPDAGPGQPDGRPVEPSTGLPPGIIIRPFPCSAPVAKSTSPLPGVAWPPPPGTRSHSSVSRARLLNDPDHGVSLLNHRVVMFRARDTRRDEKGRLFRVDTEGTESTDDSPGRDVRDRAARGGRRAVLRVLPPVHILAISCQGCAARLAVCVPHRCLPLPIR